MKCIHCARGSLKAAAEKGMTGYIKCLAEIGYYGNHESSCKNGRFQAASAEIVQARVEWFAQRQNRNGYG